MFVLLYLVFLCSFRVYTNSVILIIIYYQNATIDSVTFLKAFEEYRYCQMELLHLGRQKLFDCPACFRHQHSVHVDGNRKLYRYSKVQRVLFIWILY